MVETRRLAREPVMTEQEGSPVMDDRCLCWAVLFGLKASVFRERGAGIE